MFRFFQVLALCFTVCVFSSLPSCYAVGNDQHFERLTDQLNTYKLSLPRSASCPVLSYKEDVHCLSLSTGHVKDTDGYEPSDDPSPISSGTTTPRNCVVPPNSEGEEDIPVAWSASGPYLISPDEVDLYPQTCKDAITFRIDSTPGRYLGDDEKEKDSSESDDDFFEVFVPTSK